MLLEGLPPAFGWLNRKTILGFEVGSGRRSQGVIYGQTSGLFLLPDFLSSFLRSEKYLFGLLLPTLLLRVTASFHSFDL
jgi:hypothetical protein